jgi:hypothetical protein
MQESDGSQGPLSPSAAHSRPSQRGGGGMAALPGLTSPKRQLMDSPTAEVQPAVKQVPATVTAACSRTKAAIVGPPGGRWLLPVAPRSTAPSALGAVGPSGSLEAAGPSAGSPGTSQAGGRLPIATGSAREVVSQLLRGLAQSSARPSPPSLLELDLVSCAPCLVALASLQPPSASPRSLQPAHAGNSSGGGISYDAAAGGSGSSEDSRLVALLESCFRALRPPLPSDRLARCSRTLQRWSQPQPQQEAECCCGSTRGGSGPARLWCLGALLSCHTQAYMGVGRGPGSPGQGGAGGAQAGYKALVQAVHMASKLVCDDA